MNTAASHTASCSRKTQLSAQTETFGTMAVNLLYCGQSRVKQVSISTSCSSHKVQSLCSLGLEVEVCRPFQFCDAPLCVQSGFIFLSSFCSSEIQLIGCVRLGVLVGLCLRLMNCVAVKLGG